MAGRFYLDPHFFKAKQFERLGFILLFTFQFLLSHKSDLLPWTSGPELLAIRDLLGSVPSCTPLMLILGQFMCFPLLVPDAQGFYFFLVTSIMYLKML